jgi:molybdopterin/thiamine biosynthesis adenylyltransferase
MIEHVRFTDLLLERLLHDLAVHPPERGGALLATAGLVHELVEDTAGQYTGVEWRISDELTGFVQEAEAERRGVFIGHVHTHPDGVPDPSGADLEATANMLHFEKKIVDETSGEERVLSNSHLDRLVICVISRGAPRETDLAIGDEHRMSVHVMRRGPGGICVVDRARGSVVPIGADLEAAGVGRPGHAIAVTWAGTDRLGLPIGEDGRQLLLVPREYPLAGPLVVEEDDTGTPVLSARQTWDPGRPALTQLASLLRADAGRRPADYGARVEGLVGRLAETRGLVAGLGSVGSWLLEELVRAGVGHVELLDDEEVEGPNLSRTIYEAHHLGAAKVTAAGELCRRINPEVQVTAHQATIAEVESDLAEMCERADLVLATTDDPAGQALLNHHAYHANTTLVACGLYSRAAAGEVVLVVPGINTPCWACATGAQVAAGRGEKDYGTGRLVAELALGPAIHLVTEVAAGAALALLAGPDTPAGAPLRDLLVSDRTMGMITTSPDWDFFPTVFDGLQGHQWAPQSIWAHVERDPGCCVCGAERDAPVSEFGTHLNAVVARHRLDLETATAAEVSTPTAG